MGGKLVGQRLQRAGVHSALLRVDLQRVGEDGLLQEAEARLYLASREDRGHVEVSTTGVFSSSGSTGTGLPSTRATKWWSSPTPASLARRSLPDAMSTSHEALVQDRSPPRWAAALLAFLRNRSSYRRCSTIHRIIPRASARSPPGRTGIHHPWAALLDRRGSMTAILSLPSATA